MSLFMNDVYQQLLKADKVALDMSLQHCHVKGCFSLVIDGEKDVVKDEETGKLKHGTLTRIFIATKKIKPFDIQFHSHRYGLFIGVIHGQFVHHVAKRSHDDIGDEAVMLDRYVYKSPLNGGNGLVQQGWDWYNLSSYSVPVGGVMSLPSDMIHSVSCGKGTMWVVQEQGFDQDSSVVLGTSFGVDGLYQPPEQFQVNNMYEKVLEKVKKLVV